MTDDLLIFEGVDDDAPTKKKSTRVAKAAPTKIYPPAPLVYCGVPVGRHGLVIDTLTAEEVERLKSQGWTTTQPAKGSE